MFGEKFDVRILCWKSIKACPRDFLDQMYAEVCAYLTGNKYFELPNYRVGELESNLMIIMIMSGFFALF